MMTMIVLVMVIILRRNDETQTLYCIPRVDSTQNHNSHTILFRNGGILIRRSNRHDVFFLLINENICCDQLLKPSGRDGCRYEKIRQYDVFLKIPVTPLICRTVAILSYSKNEGSKLPSQSPFHVSIFCLSTAIHHTTARHHQ